MKIDFDYLRPYIRNGYTNLFAVLGVEGPPYR